MHSLERDYPTGNDPLLPVADQYAIPPGPGNLDQFTQDNLYTPWHDQDAMMCREYPLSIAGTTAGVGQDFEEKEDPKLWLICVQVSCSADTVVPTFVVTNGGSKYTFIGQSVAAAGPVGVAGPVRRLIVRSHDRHMTVTLTTSAGTATATGMVFALGAGFDPTQIGLF